MKLNYKRFWPKKKKKGSNSNKKKKSQLISQIMPSRSPNLNLGTFLHEMVRETP